MLEQKPHHEKNLLGQWPSAGCQGPCGAKNPWTSMDPSEDLVADIGSLHRGGRGMVTAPAMNGQR